MRVNVVLLCVLSAACAPVFSQNKPPEARQRDSQKASRERPGPEKEDVVRISVTLVQLDAVVTDKKGNPVTDLQKDDFEIYEDGKRQLITNFSFVSTPPSVPPEPKLAPPVKGSAPVPSPPVRLKPEQVRRTIAIVVDDLSLSMGSAESVQYYLRKFVERQMEPGDLVAIIRASGGMGALQQFTADKRQLLAAVDRIRWNPQSGRVGVFKPISDETMQSVRNGTARDDERKQQVEAEGADFREQLFTVGMLGALNYVVRGLRELPGRKSVLLFSEGFNLPNSARQDGLLRSASRLEDSLNRLVEFANRSAVVLYGVDPRGLVVPMLEAADDVSGLSSKGISDLILQRMHQFTDSSSGLNYLAKETGGFVVPGSNDLSRGIKRVLDDQTGYYLIGYVPAESTFKRFTGRMPFHKIAVKVKPAGLNVRTRGGFYGVTNEEARSAPLTPMQQMMAAVTSPFTSGDVRLRLTSLFGNDSKTGYYVRSLLHIDARDLSFTDEPGGWRSAGIDVAAITFGDNGVVVDQNIQSYTLRVRSDSFERTLRSGIVCTINLPLKKPGAYQLRTAVRDAKTEHIGSANQYIEVPNVNKGRLVVSAMALSGNDILADLNRRVQAEHSDDSEAAGEIRAAAGPAVRRLRPGDDLNYAFGVYNAIVDKETKSPRLLMQARLFRDGKLVYEGEAVPLRLNSQPDWKRISVVGGLKLAKTAQPGEHILQVVITDLLAKEKYRTVTQWTDFEVVK
jgi:VWFA-related protein